MTAPSGVCTSCQTPLPGDALFCPKCGASTPTGVSGERAAATVRAPIASGAEAASARRAELQRALGAGFEVKDLIGQGGFGEVWAAFDLRLKREVAVKVLLAELAGLPALHERFAREAEAAAKLRHPNIIPIYQVGETEGLAYIIMPFVRGESLRALLHREPLQPIGDARRILSEAAGALEAAHRAGIVHRDVKPENIMLEGEERRVLLMDFGIARAMEADGSRLTGTGLVIGTPQYMSPEQATAEKNIDRRSDIYSLGVVAYELLTGRQMFHSDSARDLIVQHLTASPPDPRSARKEIPEDLAEAVLRCVQKKPDERWQSAGEVAAAFAPPVAVSVESPLRWLGRKFHVGARGARRRMRIYGIAFAAVMLTLAVFSRGTLLAAWYFWTTRAPAVSNEPGSTPSDSGNVFRSMDADWSGNGPLAANLVSLGDSQLLATSHGDGPVLYDGSAWSALAVPDPVLPPIHAPSGLWIYSRVGRTSIGFRLGDRGPVPEDTLRGRVTAVWSGPAFALLGLADGGVLRGRPGAWRREPTGTEKELMGIWGDGRRQVAAGGFASGGTTDSLLIFNGLNWSTSDPRPESVRNAETWIFNAGTVLADSTIVIAGQSCFEVQGRPCRGLLIALRPRSSAWEPLGPTLPDRMELTGVMESGRQELWVWGRGDGCPSPACLLRVSRDSLSWAPPFGQDPILGVTQLRGEVVALTGGGLLWTRRAGQWGVLSQVLGSNLLGFHPQLLYAWTAATVVAPGVVGPRRFVGAGVASGNTTWEHGRFVASYTLPCQADLRVVISVFAAWDNTVFVADRSGRRLGYDDDSGGDLNARLRWTCPDTGDYRIGVSPYASNLPATGFRLSVAADSGQTVRPAPAPRAPRTNGVAVGASVAGAFDAGARYLLAALSTAGVLYTQECGLQECPPASPADLKAPVVDVAVAGATLFAATSRKLFVWRQTWQEVDVPGLAGPIVGVAGSADSVLAVLTPGAVLLSRSGGAALMRWSSVPGAIGRPQRIVVASGGHAVAVLGDAASGLLRDGSLVTVLGTRPAADALFLPDGRLVLTLPSDDPLVAGSVLVASRWQDARVRWRVLPTVRGLNPYGLEVNGTELNVGASGWARMFARLSRLPFGEPPDSARVRVQRPR